MVKLDIYTSIICGSVLDFRSVTMNIAVEASTEGLMLKTDILALVDDPFPVDYLRRVSALAALFCHHHSCSSNG